MEKRTGKGDNEMVRFMVNVSNLKNSLKKNLSPEQII